MQQPTITQEIPSLFTVFSDGTVTRFSPPVAPPSSAGPVLSKDVIVDSLKPITARIFLPSAAAADHHRRRLPVVLYIHGGGFCIGSTSWVGYHSFLSALSAAASAVVVSVDYRLAPENPLPAAYDDCFHSLKWLAANSGEHSPEPYLLPADPSRLFLAGDSAGANICHNIALRALQDGGAAVGVAGVLLLHPFFGSERRTPAEEAAAAEKEVALSDVFWKLCLPAGEDRDYCGCNYQTAALTAEVWRRYPRAEVHVAEHDFLRERGERYGEFLKGKGVERVEIVNDSRESHVFFVFFPESESTRLLLARIGAFINA